MGVDREGERPDPKLSELAVVVSPSVPPVCVEDEDRGGGLGSSVDKIADTVFAALTAAERVENCEGFLRQFPSACKPSKGLLFGNDEDDQ